MAARQSRYYFYLSVRLITAAVSQPEASVVGKNEHGEYCSPPPGDGFGLPTCAASQSIVLVYTPPERWEAAGGSYRGVISVYCLFLGQTPVVGCVEHPAAGGGVGLPDLPCKSVNANQCFVNSYRRDSYRLDSGSFTVTSPLSGRRLSEWLLRVLPSFCRRPSHSCSVHRRRRRSWPPPGALSLRHRAPA